MVSGNQKPAVLAISSHVARGSVGNRAAVFALETFGYPVWAVPTILLPWHPGHGPSNKIHHDRKAFAAFMDDIVNAPWLSEVDAVLTGYMADAEQVEIVASAVRKMKHARRDLFNVCDPVMGDVGGLYVSEETANSIRDKLIPMCDLATPNCFELAWLTNSPAGRTAAECIEQAKLLKVPSVLITSCPNPAANQTGNVHFDGQQACAAWHEALANPPNGPGDLTAATFLAHHLDGLPVEKNLKQTTSSVLEILQQSARRGSDELTLESDVESLVRPKAIVSFKKLERE